MAFDICATDELKGPYIFLNFLEGRWKIHAVCGKCLSLNFIAPGSRNFRGFLG